MQKQPVYTPREVEAIKIADRLVLRKMVTNMRTGKKEWAEKEIINDGYTLRRLIEIAQDEIPRHPSLRGAIIYVGGFIKGERMIAAMPANFVPAIIDELRG